jgi:hypothetical protein
MRARAILAMCGVIVVAVPGWASAESCLPFLTQKPNSVGGTVQLVTMNKHGVASFSNFAVDYQAGGRAPNGGVRPPQWRTRSSVGGAPADTSKQLFSDRISGPAGPSQQPFDVSKADEINVVISVEASPQVTVTLRTWGNSKAVFRVTCSVGGVMHGSTTDVDYLLLLGQSIVN